MPPRGLFLLVAFRRRFGYYSGMSITDEMKNRIAAILRQAGVRRAAVFGSFARGEAGAGSDLDLLVEFRGEKTLLDLVALKNRLEQALGIRVDVMTYQSLSPLLRDAILQRQIPVL
mgnify:FL=1